jgi:hypothetical protein
MPRAGVVRRDHGHRAAGTGRAILAAWNRPRRTEANGGAGRQGSARGRQGVRAAALWTVTPITDPGDGANYSVTLSVTTGSRFAEFADPRTAAEGSANPGGPRAGTGTVTGTIQWDVQSPTAPDLGAVPAVQQPNTSLGTVRHQIFDGNDTVVGGGHYTFTYANVAGAPYVQTG